VSVRRATLPLYAGGFLGPFGGAMIIALIPTVAADLGTSVALVALTITAYMVPFAALQLVSGTIAERVGGRRIVRAGYVGFGAAALLCAFAPGIETFIAGRATMGAANAFLTPILLAALSQAVPAAVLGRSVGTFAAVQVAGLSLAPVLGGALGLVSWRLAFGLVAAVSFALALPRLDVLRAREGQRTRPTLRSLMNRWVGVISAGGLAGYLGFTAIGFIVALLLEEEYGLSSAESGLVVACYGLGGVAFGRLGGVAADRFGRPRTALGAGLACAAGVFGLAFAPSLWGVAFVYFVIGCASSFAWAGLNTIAVESFPDNRAGAVSVYSAFKFVGTALAPVIYVPLYEDDARLPFLAAAGFALLFAALVLPWFRRYRTTEPAPTGSIG
jgi:MFS family permease